MIIKNSSSVLLTSVMTISVLSIYGMDNDKEPKFVQMPYFKEEANRIRDQRLKCEKAITDYVDNKVAKALRIKKRNRNKTKA